MKLIVYKGFDKSFISELRTTPLVKMHVAKRKDVLHFDKKLRKDLELALISLEEDADVWVTYEEYSLVKKRIDDAIVDDGLEVIVYRNNLYPDYYPLEFNVEPSLAHEIIDFCNGDRSVAQSEPCKAYCSIYNTLVDADGVLYGSFYNYEYEGDGLVSVYDFYPQALKVEDTLDQSDYDVFLNEDIDTYLRDLTSIKRLKPRIISISSTKGDFSNRIQKSLQAYCAYNTIRLVAFKENMSQDRPLEHELIDIARNDIKIDGFEKFRSIKFYKNPDIDKEVIEISQSQIIQEIIKQAEKSYNYDRGDSFRDIFITASTGAGKSVMFQIPAVYLAKKHNKLTIIIEPVKALMQDQKEKLVSAGYTRVEAFNSDLITQVEKEKVLERIKSGEIDLLYLSPETLLSYSIETIIGDREIGLVVVDEAHIVTTWGVGFRPDYWYLGGYLNRLRNQIQTSRGKERKAYHFPICAFTATVINGGIDDSVSDTIISLYMENPIRYLGYVRRDDIHFEITHPGNGVKLPMPQYQEQKCKALNERIQNWLKNNQKTIVYYPFASLASEASKGQRAFAGITTDKRIGMYVGRNIDDLSNEAFNDTKRQAFEAFRQGIKPIMYATKAFGMGIDVNDVQNVYHYAVSGNLSDYVQEIGRAARIPSMEGKAITDFFANDMRYMQVLFGMSQIKQYQIKKVLEGIYETYKSKKGARSFLITPEAFTYIFSGRNEDSRIGELKTCLLMIEKDFYDKYNFKVLVSRPQSVFTKAYICIVKEKEKEVLASKYGKYISFVAKGRNEEQRMDGTLLSDVGDVFSLELKSIWEDYYPNISFPQFKYWYFNAGLNSSGKIDIMPSIREHIKPRQKVNIEAKGDFLLSELRELILNDFEYIADQLYSKFGRQYFSTDDFIKMLSEKYGKTKARIIANSLFDLVDPVGKCIKRRSAGDSTGALYSLSHGNFKEFMRKPIIKSSIMHSLSLTQATASYTGFISLMSDENSSLALKLLSVFDYITYEVTGGEEPEIFIRLNDPSKIRNIVLGNTFYSNNYVSKSKKKHERDVNILRRFFVDLTTDVERWDFIEDYFLGHDVLYGEPVGAPKPVKMSRSMEKEQSYTTKKHKDWDELFVFFDDIDYPALKKLKECGIPIPEYLETVIKHSDEGKDIVMSWPSKDTLICSQDTSDATLEHFSRKGWHAYRISNIDYDAIKGELL